MNKYVKQTGPNGQPVDINGKQVPIRPGMNPSTYPESYIPADKWQFKKQSSHPMDKQEIVKIWRQRLKVQLADLSSLEFQKKAWVDRTDPNIWWEWTEVICGYFDDLWLNEKGNNEGLQYHRRENRLTSQEVGMLRPFNDAFGAYADKTDQPNDNSGYEKILADPEWIKITQMAKELLEKIDFDKLP